MQNGIIVCNLSLIKIYLLAFYALRKFRDSAPLKTRTTLRMCHFEEFKESVLEIGTVYIPFAD